MDSDRLMEAEKKRVEKAAQDKWAKKDAKKGRKKHSTLKPTDEDSVDDLSSKSRRSSDRGGGLSTLYAMARMSQHGSSDDGYEALSSTAPDDLALLALDENPGGDSDDDETLWTAADEEAAEATHFSSIVTPPVSGDEAGVSEHDLTYLINEHGEVDDDDPSVAAKRNSGRFVLEGPESGDSLDVTSKFEDQAAAKAEAGMGDLNSQNKHSNRRERAAMAALTVERNTRKCRHLLWNILLIAVYYVIGIMYYRESKGNEWNVPVSIYFISISITTVRTPNQLVNEVLYDERKMRPKTLT